MNRRFFRLLIAVLLLVLSGCGSASVAPLPAPPKVSELPTSTTLPDFSDVSLQRVSGTTTTLALPFHGGQASISGRVTVGGAPVGGATVHVERFDGDTSAGSMDVTTNPDGTYTAGSLNGGRYRVRAFRPPDATTPQAQVFFLGATDNKSLDLAMSQYSGGTTVSASVYPDPPTFDSPSIVTISVYTRGVDGTGVARSIPSAGVPVSLTSSSGRAVVSANPSVTASNGRVSFTIVCLGYDHQGLTVTVPGAAPASVSVSDCEDATTTTTTPPSTTTTTIFPATTTTTRKKP